MLQVGAHDARVVGWVPVARRRCLDECEPQPHGPRRRLPGEAAGEGDRFASIPQQALVDLPPPSAAGDRRVERIEHAAALLPAHEGERRAPKRQMTGGAARWPVVCPGDQPKTPPRIVPDGGDLSPSRGEGASLLCHPKVTVQLVCVFATECWPVLV